MIRPFDITKRDITRSGPNILTLLAGAASLVLGLMVLVGWYTENTALLQVLPGFVAMVYNTALGFFLSGAGLLLVAFRKSLVGAVLGAIVGILGLLTLVQYVFGVDLWIDQFLMTAYTVSQTSAFAPGRMALNTAICFTLAGLALIVMATSPRWLRQQPLMVGILGSLVIALAAVPFFGYLTGVANAYGWGALTRMAVHTAAGFIVIGVGIVAFAWQEDRAGKRGAPNWLPVLVGMGTVIVTLLLWQALVSEQRTHTQRIVTSETAVIKSQIADRMGFRILVLTRLAARWNIYGTPTKEKWEADARLLVDPGTVNRAVQSVDPSFHVRWIASADGNREESRDLGADPPIRTALETARDQRKTVVTGGVSLAGGSKGIMVTVPTFQGDRFDGFVIGLFENELLFNTLIGDETARGYSVAVQSGGNEIYGNHAGNREYYAELHQETEVELPGTTWRIDVWPRSGLVAERESPFPLVVLIAGMTMAVLLSLAMYLAQTARLRTRQAEVTNLELDREISERKGKEVEIKELNRDLERRVDERTAELQTTNQELEGEIAQRKLAAERSAFLVQASTTLASSLDYEDTLTRVARISVPQIADWCTVDIVDDDGQVQRVTMAHADPVKEEMARDYLRRFPPKPDSDSGVTMVLRTLESVLVPEIDLSMLEASVTDPEQLELIRKFQPTSAMIVPLVAHGHAVGAISLLTAESGRRYGPEDLVLAEEVARRAATAVENARLYSQTLLARTHAETIGEELKKIVTELERSNTELQQFAYVASHDLQEPLRMVASYTQLLSRRYSGKLDEAADEFIAYAVDGATRMQRLINDLLAYSRVTSQGKAFERTDCEAILKQALANLQMALRETNAVVTHDPLPTVMGDDSQLTQLFQNLIGNAIKFHGDEPPAIHIGVERKEDEWLICVRDNGIGMDSQYADRIFVIFQRLHSKEEYPGTGIGLSVCKKVVERHGGRIWVQSKPGEGSTFYFTMPVN